jgi:hypothetical protein
MPRNNYEKPKVPYGWKSTGYIRNTADPLRLYGTMFEAAKGDFLVSVGWNAGAMNYRIFVMKGSNEIDAVFANDMERACKAVFAMCTYYGERI